MRRSFVRSAVCVLMLSASLLAATQTPAPPTAPSADDLNATYTKAMQTKDWVAATAAAQQMIQAHPSADNLLLLGNAQLYSGAMQDALATYERAVAAAQTEKPATGQPDAEWRKLVAKIYVGRGNAFLKLRRNSEAVDSYTSAAEIDPNPGLAYFNICAALYNIGDVPNSTVGCRKSVAADPSRANAWFVLGSDLFVDAKADAQGKFVISAECRQALEKYLELAPDGPHASDTKAMLDMAAK